MSVADLQERLGRFLDLLALCFPINLQPGAIIDPPVVECATVGDLATERDLEPSGRIALHGGVGGGLNAIIRKGLEANLVRKTLVKAERKGLRADQFEVFVESIFERSSPWQAVLVFL